MVFGCGRVVASNSGAEWASTSDVTSVSIPDEVSVSEVESVARVVEATERSRLRICGKPSRTVMRNKASGSILSEMPS